MLLLAIMAIISYNVYPAGPKDIKYTIRLIIIIPTFQRRIQNPVKHLRWSSFGKIVDV